MTPTRPFSEREQQIAALLADGTPNKAIGTALGISTNTVEKHVERMAAAIPQPDAPGRTRVMLWAHERKVLGLSYAL